MATAGVETVSRPLPAAPLAVSVEEDPFAEEKDGALPVLADAAGDGVPRRSANGSSVPERGSAEAAPPLRASFSPLETVETLTGGGRVLGTFCGMEAAALASRFPPGCELQQVNASGSGVQLCIILTAERGIRRLLSGLTLLLRMLPDASVVIAVRWPGGCQSARLVVRDGLIYREVE